MIVMKFGGMSLKNAEMFKKSAEIVLAEPREKIVVVSAVAGITNRLINLANESAGKNSSWISHFNSLRDFCFNLVKDLFDRKSAEYGLIAETTVNHLKELREVLNSIYILRELTLPTLDSIMSLGEIFSANIFSALLRELNTDSRPVLQSRIRTDNNFGNAEIYPEATAKELEYLKKLLLIKHIPIVPGFIGTTEDFTTTTLGRNGSDYTAAAIANIFGAEELQIWKEVDGVMQADPKLVPEAKVLNKISYEEAMEMTYFGSRVLHPKSILPAIQKKIPIRIKNTCNPEAPGTLIFSESNVSESGLPRRSDAKAGVKVITVISDLALVNVVGKGMMGVAGIAARVFGATAEAGANVMMISQASSEQSICFVVQEKDREKSVREIEKEFELEIHRSQLEKVESESGISIISIVGDGMRGSIGTDAEFATALARAGINNKATAQGSSERNISRAIESKDVEKAVRSVYDAFFKEERG